MVCLTASLILLLDRFFFLPSTVLEFLFVMSSRRDPDRDRGDRGDRDRASRAQQQQAQARTNEYFVPKEGIDREVITADICRYLGNDALVRPGTYEVGPESDFIQHLVEMANGLVTEPADSPSPAGLFHHRIPKPDNRNVAPSQAYHNSSLIVPATGHDCRSQGRF